LTAEPTAFVLDTNVVIDIEHFYFGHPSMRMAAAGKPARTEREDLRRLLATFALQAAGGSVDLLYGLAACEIGVRRDGSIDASAYRSAVHAAQVVVEWTGRHIDRAFANRHAPISRDATYLRSRPRPPMQHSDVMTIIGPSYGALLKISHLCRPGLQRGSRQARNRIEEYISWMLDTLGVCLPYETRIAIAMMAGSPDAERMARMLMKYGGGTNADLLADNAWNTAWDLCFLRMAEGHTFGMTPKNGGNEVTALVTRDHDPTWLRAAGSIRALLNPGQDPHMILTEVKLDVCADAVGDEIAELVEKRLGGILTPERLLRDRDDMSRAALRAVADLEREIGVTVLTGSRA
jgi:hypothetical protein